MITVEQVTVRRSGRALIEDQCWQVPPGRMTAILGPNGAGKTTALKVISGELRPDSGVIRFAGRPLQQYDAAEIARQRAVVPQSSSLSFPFSVREVVQMGRAPHRRHSSKTQDHQVVEAALVAADLVPLAEQRYPSLSGGERQRVHFARALAQIWDAPAPHRLLLLDEPTAALDPAHQHQMMQRLRRLVADGMAVAVILHDLALALRYADHVVLLRQGRVMAEGPTESTATPQILSAIYDCPVRLLTIPGEIQPVVVTG